MMMPPPLGTLAQLVLPRRRFAPGRRTRFELRVGLGIVGLALLLILLLGLFRVWGLA